MYEMIILLSGELRYVLAVRLVSTVTNFRFHKSCLLSCVPPHSRSFHVRIHGCYLCTNAG